jgi:hypothetical protein
MNRNYFSLCRFPYILQGFHGGKSALPEREIWNSRVNHTSDDTAFTSDDTGKAHVDNRSLTGILNSADPPCLSQKHTWWIFFHKTDKKTPPVGASGAEWLSLVRESRT